MKLKNLRPNLLLTLFLGSLGTYAKGEEASSYQTIADHYEAIRLVLLGDGTEGIAEHASAIESRARKPSQEFGTAKAGVSEDGRALLPLVAAAAARLSQAGSIETTRKAFFELSKRAEPK